MYTVGMTLLEFDISLIPPSVVLVGQNYIQRSVLLFAASAWVRFGYPEGEGIMSFQNIQSNLYYGMRKAPPPPSLRNKNTNI